MNIYSANKYTQVEIISREIINCCPLIQVLEIGEDLLSLLLFGQTLCEVLLKDYLT
jgi:hypothetical protein